MGYCFLGFDFGVSTMNRGLPIRVSCAGFLLAMSFSAGAALGQAAPYLEVPPERFTKYCYYDSGVYSVNANFCVKANTSIMCVAEGGQAGKTEAAHWQTVSPDVACVNPK